MNKSILIGNFPTPPYDKLLVIQRKKVTYAERYFCGYDSEYTRKEKNEKVISNILLAILLFDNTYLFFRDYMQLFSFLNTKDILTILEHKIIKIIPDGNILPSISFDSPRRFETFSANISQQFDFIESTLKGENHKFKKDIIQYSENAVIDISLTPNKVGSLIRDELACDLINMNVRSGLKIESSSIDQLEEIDVLKILRIANICKNLIYQSVIGATCNEIDGYSNIYMSNKVNFTSYMPQPSVLDNFFSLLKMKGVPDFYYLYKNNIVSLDDVLELRDNINGKVFREWYYQSNYNQEELLRLLLNSKKKFGFGIDLLKWIYPKIIGVFSPVAGIAASAVDSFLITKLIAGWKPQLFLDEVLKKRIDNNVVIYEQSKRREMLVKRYGSVGRNAQCPCQSGKKYKNCCGK